MGGFRKFKFYEMLPAGESLVHFALFVQKDNFRTAGKFCHPFFLIFLSTTPMYRIFSTQVSTFVHAASNAFPLLSINFKLHSPPLPLVSVNVGGCNVKNINGCLVGNGRKDKASYFNDIS